MILKKIKLAENEEILYNCISDPSIFGYLALVILSGILFIFSINKDNILAFFLQSAFLIIVFIVMIYSYLYFFFTKTIITSIRVIQIKRKKLFIKKIKNEIKMSNILFLENNTYSLEIVPQSEDIQHITRSRNWRAYSKYKIEVGYIIIHGRDNTLNIIEIIKKIISLNPHPNNDFILLNRQINWEFR